MHARDYRDLIGGALLFLTGIAFSWYGAEHYRLGTVARMGPGLFPVALGAVLALLGAILCVQALLRPGTLPEIRPARALPVLGGIGLFALAIHPLGLIPAICLLVVISSLAELRLRPLTTLAVCAAMSLAAWLIFGLGLGLPIPMIRAGW